MQECTTEPGYVRVRYRYATAWFLTLACVVSMLFLSSGCRNAKRTVPYQESAKWSVQPQEGGQKSIESGGLERRYSVHLPPSYEVGTPTPLIIAFHGGGGDGEGMELLTHMDEISDRERFIVVYPDGINRNWNDGRSQINPGVDDVGFVRDLLDQLGSDYSIDTKRVYATGISNGGFMSYRLAFDLSGRFAAIASVGAPLSEQRPVP